MNTNDLNPKQLLKVTKIIFFALIAGQLFFLLVVLSITGGKFIFKTDVSDPLLLSCLILDCITLPFGFVVAKKLFDQIDPNAALMQKLAKFQSGQIIRLATCEGAGLLAIICLMLTSNSVYLIFLVITFTVMIRYYPSPDMIGRCVNLTQGEIDSLT